MSIAAVLRRRWKWLAGAVAVVLLVVVGGPFVYINFIKEDAPERLSLSSGSSTTTAEDGATTTTAADPPDSGGATVTALDGTWTVSAGSIVGYRVEEVLFGQNTEAAGRTEGVTGEIVVSGTTVESGSFVADLTTVTSDEDRRDGQFQERIMDTATWPTATFELTAPLELTTIPDDLVQVTTPATGDLTVRDVTKSVTFDVVAQRNGDTIEINGSIPIVWADYGIPEPSFGPATVEDHGEMEFLLILERATVGVSEPLAVGLVGAGPWAQMVHAPVLAAGPETRLAGVWARRPEAAAELAGAHGTQAFDRVDDLYAACEAVAFCVPPAVQATLALDAVAAGKAVLLEKPIADDLAGAERLAAAVGEAGVASMVVLSWRYADAVRAFLDEAAGFDALGGRAAFVSGALLGGPFATPWRLERGPLLDLGPHVIDLLDAALGPVVGVRAHGNLLGWVGLLLEHEGGRFSEASLCASASVVTTTSGIQLYGTTGELTLDCATAVGAGAFRTLRQELADAVRSGGGHPLDVQRGLHLQRILSDAEAQLR